MINPTRLNTMKKRQRAKISQDIYNEINYQRSLRPYFDQDGKVVAQKKWRLALFASKQQLKLIITESQFRDVLEFDFDINDPEMLKHICETLDNHGFVPL